MSALVAIGINYRTAPIELRERTALDPGAIAPALANAKAQLALREVVLLSTCNRTELYAVVDRDERFDRDAAIRFLMRDTDVDVDSVHKHFYEHKGRDVVEHLLGVCASLDSMVIGEVEIFGAGQTGIPDGDGSGHNRQNNEQPFSAGVQHRKTRSHGNANHAGARFRELNRG